MFCGLWFGVLGGISVKITWAKYSATAAITIISHHVRVFVREMATVQQYDDMMDFPLDMTICRNERDDVFYCTAETVKYWSTRAAVSTAAGDTLYHGTGLSCTIIY